MSAIDRMNAKACIEDSDEVILERYAPEDMRKAVEAKLAVRAAVAAGSVGAQARGDARETGSLEACFAKADERAGARRSRFGFAVAHDDNAGFAWKRVMQFAAPAFAAACCLAFVTFAVMRNQPGAGIARTAEVTGIPGGASADSVAMDRIKGGAPRMFVYRKNGNEAVPLSEGSLVKPNDVLQVSYVAGSDVYGAILSIDGKGVVTQHFPERGDWAGALSHKGEIALDYSYQLDDAPAFERFVFVSANKGFSAKDLREALKREALKRKAGAKAAIDAAKLLPPGARASQILLLKEGTK